MIGTENSYYSNSCCCSTHPDPIWNLEATTIIEHQIKSVLYSLLMISKQKKEKIEPNELGKLTGFGDFNAENYRKSLIQHCERSELRLHFEWTKVNSKCQKWSILANFWKPEACGQTVLPDRSVLIGQKLVENTKIQMRLNMFSRFWHFLSIDRFARIITRSFTVFRH